MLVELQAAGHTTFAQYSTCVRDVVRDYLLNSEVGISFERSKAGVDGVFGQLPQGFTQCAADSDDYFVTNTTNARRDRLWRK